MEATPVFTVDYKIFAPFTYTMLDTVNTHTHVHAGLHLDRRQSALNVNSLNFLQHLFSVPDWKKNYL